MNGDQRAQRAKARIDRGLRAAPDRESRPYFCRTCGKEQRGAGVPEGWYSLSRHRDWQTPRPISRLGLFCSLACLARQLPRLEGVEADLGAAWQAADTYTQERDRPLPAHLD